MRYMPWRLSICYSILLHLFYLYVTMVQTLLSCRMDVCKALGMAEKQCELSMGMSNDFEQAVIRYFSFWIVLFLHVLILLDETILADIFLCSIELSSVHKHCSYPTLDGFFFTIIFIISQWYESLDQYWSKISIADMMSMAFGLLRNNFRTKVHLNGCTKIFSNSDSLKFPLTNHSQNENDWWSNYKLHILWMQIKMGSTNVRIGSTIFGPREYPKRQWICWPLY